MAGPITENLELGGTYRLTRPLGQGGMGEVWEAEHLRLPKKVAVKFLLVQGEIEAEWLSRFKREAEIASQLHHPNIIEVHDFNVTADGVPYIVMELLSGEDLRAKLGRGPLSLPEAKAITRQVVSALSLAHAHGIVHRDLKPENIFLCTEPDGHVRAKILDFGISKLQGQSVTFQTREHSLLGTPGYMSPEQAMGKHAALDGRADLFALATIFYEMVTGQTIFRGDSLAEVVYKVVNHMPEPLNQVSPKVPASVAEAVAKALAKDPAERQPSVAEFGAALDGDTSMAETLVSMPSPPLEPSFSSKTASVPGTEATLMGDAAGGSDTPQTERVERSGGKRGGTAMVAGAALAVIVGAAGYFMLREQASSTHASAAADTTAEAAPPTVATALDDVPSKAPAVTQGASPPAVGPAKPAVEGVEPIGPQKGPTVDNPDEPTAAVPEKSPSKPSAEDKLSASVRALLGDARSALQSGDTSRAISLARKSLREQSTQAAYEIMARAYCEKRDLGMAKAMLRNLRGQNKRRTVAACREHGLNL